MTPLPFWCVTWALLGRRKPDVSPQNAHLARTSPTHPAWTSPTHLAWMTHTHLAWTILTRLAWMTPSCLAWMILNLRHLGSIRCEMGTNSLFLLESRTSSHVTAPSLSQEGRILSPEWEGGWRLSCLHKATPLNPAFPASSRHSTPSQTLPLVDSSHIRFFVSKV